jgi:cytoskeletal protein CcmA (bactofilin family)
MKLLRFFVVLLALLFIAPAVLYAQEKPVPKPTPTPSVTVVTGGSVFRGGETVVIDESVDGDVYCAGQSVTIRGLVTGDVICASQNLSIEGKVFGNVRVVGQHVNLSSSVGRNVTVLGQSITLSQQASIAGELLAAGQTMTLSGTVGKGAKVAAQSVSLNGQVRGDVFVAAETFDIGNGTVIDGALSYQATKQITVPASAHVKGPVTFTQAEEHKSPKKNISVAWPAKAVGSILIYMGVGLLIIIFTKKLFPAITGHMREKPLGTLLLGVAGVVLVPFVLLVLTLTIIGIPVAFLVGIAYALVLMVAKLFTAVIVGQWVLEALVPKAKGNAVYQVLVGVPITFLTLKMPFIGAVLSPFALFWGTGGIISSILARRKK